MIALPRRLRWLWRRAATAREILVRDEDDRWFDVALHYDPRRVDPTILAPRHVSDEVADHTLVGEHGYTRPDEHEGRHRKPPPWWEPDGFLSSWYGHRSP